MTASGCSSPHGHYFLPNWRYISFPDAPPRYTCIECGIDWPPLPCRHLSLSGDEGPIADLGRFPQRWRCDDCGMLFYDLGNMPILNDQDHPAV